MPNRMSERNAKFDEALIDDLARRLERRSGLAFEGERRAWLAAVAEEYARGRRMTPAAMLKAVAASPGEYESLLDRVLASDGKFRRHAAIFDVFERRLLPEMHMKKFWDRPRALRVWSAGCGAGEEAYSIAISVLETLASLEAWNVELFGCDLRRQAIQMAERGVYPRSAFDAMPAEQVENYFGRAGEMLMVKPRLRGLVKFACANLLEGEYMGRFDCIFCLDVLGWLSAPRRAQLLERFYEHLEPGGYVLLAPREAASMASYGRFAAVSRDGEIALQKPAGMSRNLAVAGGM
jgi:chemotaxis protein methyltransferase CheR